jgi:hypothetical protein
MERTEGSNDYHFKVVGKGITTELVIFYHLGGEGEERTYGIPLSGIGGVMDDFPVSEWIIQLYKKTWVSKGMLYDLAKEIVKLSPENQIDWIETFYAVEKYHYLVANRQPDDAIEGQISAFDTVVREIQHSRELAEDVDFRQNLETQVKEQLERKGIIQK